MNNLSSTVSLGKKRETLTYIILAVMDLVISFDYTRGGVIYTTDSTIFIYNYPIVSYHYLLMAIYSYYPWYTQAPTFSIFTFIYNILPFLFTLVPFIGDTLYILALSYLGSVFLYRLIYEVLKENYSNSSEKVIRISSLIGSLFYLINPQILVNNTFADLGIGTYVYILTPGLLYEIRKVFTANNAKEFLPWFLMMISTAALLYYFIVPIYALPFAITASMVLSFYSLISFKRKKYIRLILIFSTLILFILTQLDNIIHVYNGFVSPSFIQVSYTYWVGNANQMPLFETLRGLIFAIRLPEISYILSFMIVLVYLTPLLLSRRKLISSEVLFFIIMFLSIAFLYSMPNVPFSDFFKALFFRFPILVDLRTQYVLVGPFEGLTLSIVLGFGTYYIIDAISSRGIEYVVLAVMLVLISVVGVNYEPLVFGLNQYTNTVHVPGEFIAVVDYINSHSSSNSSVLILPISATENAEKWYNGNNLFNLFLVSKVILGGGYYSHSNEERSVIDAAEVMIGESNLTEKAIIYLYNFLYLYNIHYIILEKDYIYTIYHLDYSFPIRQLYSGLNNFSKIGMWRLEYNNTLYSVYHTSINSSFIFLSFENISENLTSVMASENLSNILYAEHLVMISPAEYVIYVSPDYVNKTIYMYLMLPYSSRIEINGGDILGKSMFLGGYILLKLYINSTKLTLVYSDYYRSFTHGLSTSVLEIALPIISAVLLMSIGSRFKLNYLETISKYF